MHIPFECTNRRSHPPSQPLFRRHYTRRHHPGRFLDVLVLVLIFVIIVVDSGFDDWLLKYRLLLSRGERLENWRSAPNPKGIVIHGRVEVLDKLPVIDATGGVRVDSSAE